MKFVKKNREETLYPVPEIAQAIGLSEGTIRGYFMNKSKKRPNKSTRNGLTLADIVAVLERDRKRGDGIDFGVVAEIRNRLIVEEGYVLDRTDEEGSSNDE